MATDIRYTRHGREITKSGLCTSSGKLYQVTLTNLQWNRWVDGSTLRKAAPFLNEEQREFMINSTTPYERRKA